MEENSTAAEPARPLLPPGQARLTATQLTVLMLSLIFGPIAGGLALFWNSSPSVEPLLPGEVKLSTEWVESKEKGRRLVPCILIRNTSSGRWGKLSVGLNEQFYSTGNMQVAANSNVVLPLDSFIARNGSVRFPVGNRSIEHVILFAQLESGERGVSEFQIPSINGAPLETDWIQPMQKTHEKAPD